ncbi:Beta-scruin [Melipona quadrifasciata]|uniref:Beta-scruin n=1 Tax=Melipona quadrifasciata TaxID=166423 RepID=A0A0M8ZW88_9HYME|nr:Beta-scruin [Melipona quadrifasciata]
MKKDGPNFLMEENHKLVCNMMEKILYININYISKWFVLLQTQTESFELESLIRPQTRMQIFEVVQRLVVQVALLVRPELKSFISPSGYCQIQKVRKLTKAPFSSPPFYFPNVTGTTTFHRKYEKNSKRSAITRMARKAWFLVGQFDQSTELFGKFAKESKKNSKSHKPQNGCAPNVEVLPISDVKQSNVRNLARMGVGPALANSLQQESLPSAPLDESSSRANLYTHAASAISVTLIRSSRLGKVGAIDSKLCAFKSQFTGTSFGAYNALQQYYLDPEYVATYRSKQYPLWTITRFNNRFQQTVFNSTRMLQQRPLSDNASQPQQKNTLIPRNRRKVTKRGDYCARVAVFVQFQLNFRFSIKSRTYVHPVAVVNCSNRSKKKLQEHSRSDERCRAVEPIVDELPRYNGTDTFHIPYSGSVMVTFTTKRSSSGSEDLSGRPSRKLGSDLLDTPHRLPVYPIDRRKAAFRRRRRLSKRRTPVNVHVYREQARSLSENRRAGSKKVQLPERRSDLARYTTESAKNSIRPRGGSSTRQDDDSDDPDRDRRSNNQWKRDRTFEERCRPSDNSVSKLMARSSPGKDGDCKQRNKACPNLTYLTHTRSREQGDVHRAFVSLNDGGNAKRVFPFQQTASGNLKIIPNQVVFESNKVSVLVADPKHAKVNVKAELNRAGNELAGRVSESATRPSPIDLPLRVSSSTIDQLQSQKNLPSTEDDCRPTIHPFKGKFSQVETMEHKQQSTSSATHEIPVLQEVPLSILGFTSEQPIDWDNVILPEKTDLYQELARRITNYKNADCIVRIDHDEFHCHLLVLQSYSSFFDEKNCKEIDLTESDVSSKAFSLIYDWMISSQNESYRLLQRDNILEIFTAAQYLGIKELEEQCWAFIDNDELFTEDTAFLLYLEAKKVGNTAVMELMVPRIMKFFLMLVSTKDFLQLSVDELCLLLKSNYICVNSEMEVLMSAVRWLMHDWVNRKQHMLEVLKCVRFGLIAPWQLVDVKRNPENPEFMELMSSPEVQKMVDDGLAFVIIKYWYGNQTEDYYHWIDLLGLTEPTNRNWAGEDKNYVTYREFLLYLEEYQRTKISELKIRKSRVKPTTIGSPRNDYAFTAPKIPNNYIQSSGNNDDIIKLLQSIELKSKLQRNLTKPDSFRRHCCHPQWASNAFEAIETGTVELPAAADARGRDDASEIYERVPEQLGKKQRVCNAISAVERHPRLENASNALSWNLFLCFFLGADTHNDERNVAFDARFTGGGESPRVSYRSSAVQKYTKEHRERGTNSPDIDKLDYESRQGKNATDVCRCQQQRESNFIFSTRKRHSKIHEKYKLCLTRCFFKFETRASCYTTEEQRRQQIPQNLTSQRDPLKSIKTIKSPMFFSNYDEKTSSPSDTDTDDPNSPRTDAKSTTINLADVVINEKNNEKNYPRSDNIQRVKPATRNVQIRSANCKRALPQRISNSIIATNEDDYFFDNSLFFPDRESILVFGGVNSHEEYGRPGNTGKDIRRFKPDENIWEFVGEIPRARHHHSVAYLKGRIYVVEKKTTRAKHFSPGGADPVEDKLHRKSIAVSSVWSYDPTTRTWFNEPGMLTARKDFGLVVSHGKMYAIGGQGRNGIALKTTEAFDPTDSTWREVQSMQTARIGPASAKYRDLIWVAGGMTKSKKELFSKDVECYDPIKNLLARSPSLKAPSCVPYFPLPRWLKAIPLRSPRCFASFYVVSDCLYVIGGASTMENATQSIDSIDVWDANDCVWKEHANMSIARHGHSTGSIVSYFLQMLPCNLHESFTLAINIAKETVSEKLPFVIIGTKTWIHLYAYLRCFI